MAHIIKHVVQFSQESTIHGIRYLGAASKVRINSLRKTGTLGLTERTMHSVMIHHIIYTTYS